MSSRPLAFYFSSPTTWRYLGNAVFVTSYDLPGVFDSLPRPVVNGSLWTIGPEFCCYLFIAAAAILATASLTAPGLAGARPVLQAVVFFLIGAALAHLPPGFSFPLVPALIGVVVWGGLAALVPSASAAIAWVVLPYAVVSVGIRSTPVLRRAGRFGDLSYGIYLWGFLVQQLAVSALPGISLAGFIAVVVPATVAIAVVSWHLLERPVLERARRVGRGVVRQYTQRPGLPHPSTPS